MISSPCLAAFCLLAARFAAAQTSCSTTISAKYPSPSIASGYSARIIANGLKSPRGITFDEQGNLLVVEPGNGITALKLDDAGGNCLSVKSKTTVIGDKSLNHAIQVSSDGKTLYASNSDKAFKWDYDGGATKNTSGPTTIVQNMDNSDHTTRTLLLSKKVDGMILVSRGSSENVDPVALDIKSGHSQIRAFNLKGDGQPFDYANDGILLGWGLRNSVGVAEEPNTGGIWSVENGVDDVKRNGKDFHTDNPGEELNFHGYLNGTKASVQGANFGYPTCFAVWKADDIPEAQDLHVGSQFAIGTLNATNNDTLCADKAVGPRLTFPAHWAPLDIKFNTKGSVAYITSHGSWDREDPDGYLLFGVAFADGNPVEKADSSNSYVPIMKNVDNSKCPDGCFRPVGLAWDSKGRLFMTSDSTGEIYVVGKADGGAVDGQTLPSGSSSGGAGSSPTKGSAAMVTAGLSANGYLGLAIAIAAGVSGLI